MLTRQIDSKSGVTTSNEMMAANPHSPVLVKTIDMPKGYIDVLHQHTWHQIIFPIKGLLQTQTEHYQHLVPHTSALFVPAGVQHESIALSNTIFVGIYLNPEFGATYEPQVRTIALTPFLNELLQEIRRQCEGETSHEEVLHLLAVLHDQILKSNVQTFQLLLPQDRRLKLIFEQLTDEPALSCSLKEWGEKIGASERTLSRLFAKEFNTSFLLWRQQIRLIYSLSLLDESLPIQAIADLVGYQNDSSYIKAFKAYFDMTPQQFRVNGASRR
ncbi:TPA: helix-turn-helix transcriptional regulator [Vibrio parahaemolyticus]|uniref:AraC family transcriptional regulator n=1 Tax=Vibrio parahaemolyticus TaxID=670 RepID=UPI0015DF165F|nr:helix-turn-helix transcriptional regulator [Vibrio parahaemolyticus]MBM4983068.1 helix-turn-helix transcriptional regulator [Vibrio parahaemolyticus]HCE2178749.1 helix-turn-helix transcriptional regulator [Vibrio parahaemolyticus]HCG7543349.1 helix-turn-helix transcriptional regulator [Vibrio parahaemolyticus]HCG7545249.1 helix-turn-helix transcriptional regulator [Vibrio parahaemolyticus]HCH0357613.1 helix-turn-helix transcriptional regulator [Vibrio parahaemolyticus]